MSLISKLSPIALALVLLSATPLMAADAPAPGAAPKADPSALLKDKATNMLEQSKADAQKKLSDSLAIEKPAGQNVEVNTETVIEQTPQGAVEESVTTVTPENPPAK